MCGISGIAFEYSVDNLSFIDSMSLALKSRGPDDNGVWIDQCDGIAFGHRRLSILDLSPAGHQPMQSKSGRFVITYNGEIYNYLEIRNELIKKGVGFSGHSDTEVMLAAFEEWGIVNSVKRFNGMFAFGVWDKENKKLILVRDRFGEKPLHYGFVDGVLIFGSELKALKEYKPWKPRINRSILNVYLRYSYIPAPYSIYEGISKLLPGTILEISSDRSEVLHCYWNIEATAKSAAENSFYFSSEDEAVNVLHKLLSKAVEQRCISDVPLGIFFSGGVDSSLIAALMQESANSTVRTFTVGFGEDNFNNEAPYAKKVATHLGTQHTEFYATNRDVLNIVPDLCSLYCEPFADSSQISTYLVSKLARHSVTVALSGDAGDEIFGGYNRYCWLDKVYKNFSKYPDFIWRLLILLKENQWDYLYQKVSFNKQRVAFVGQKIHKVARAFQHSNTKQEFYRNICSVINAPARFLLDSDDCTYREVSSNASWTKNNDFAHWMMLADTVGYLPGDILAKVDRAAMGVSLETRTPFLDPDIFSFAWMLPIDYKIRNGQNKYLLRQLLYRYVPEEMLERPKVGFGAPIGTWIKTSLRDWAEELLDEKKLKTQGYFNVEAVRYHWKQHLSGVHNWEHSMWNFLMFQSWLEKNNG